MWTPVAGNADGGKLSSISLEAIKASLAAKLDRGVIDESVIDAILLSRDAGEVAPIEGYFLDYKRQSPDAKDAVALSKTALQIVSLYNTYGGYLIYGIDGDKNDQRFWIKGHTGDDVNIKQLKDLIRSYTSANVDFSFGTFEVSVASHSLKVGILQVPRRSHTTPPIKFGKNGPHDKSNKPLFHREDVYFRDLDNCVPAKTREHWQLLLSERDLPFKRTSYDRLLAGSGEYLENNLPDRNFVCPKFIGRESVIEKLWAWLGDELSSARVLAGEGGRGKTSIAYEFAEGVCRTRPCGFERVLWVTAKTKQYVGAIDDFVFVPETHYRSFDELLSVLCTNSGVNDAEVGGASLTMKKKMLRGTYPIFCV